MTSPKDGGPAFPVPVYKLAADTTPIGMYPEGGMSLRDYFAAKAMLGDLSSQSESSGFYEDQNAAILAGRSYRFADAMLEARKK